MMIEAMLCWTPFLSINAGAISIIIRIGGTGFNMENNLLKCITATVIRTLNSLALKKIAENARL
jgi:hypothetical protein